METAKQRKWLTTSLKIGISIGLLYFIYTKIDFKEVATILKGAKILWLLTALGLFFGSKLLNAFRLNLYFHEIGVKLTHLSNFKLYLLGMFYNLFLPGGIGGDAYKGYVIQKKYQVGTKKVVGVLVLDRLSGMLFILIYALVFAALLDNEVLAPFVWLFWIAIPLGVFCFWVLNKYWFSYGLPVFWPSIGYSALLQITQLLAAFCILKALQVDTNYIAYLLVFMVSSIVSVIPLTIGGVGSREVTFLYGAQWLNLETTTSVGISFTFFLVTAVVSLIGIYYHFKKPELTTVSN